MKRILILFAISFILANCQQATVGFLTTEEASYNPDTLVVKAVLDTTPPDIIPNPEWDQWLGFGFTPDEILEMEIFPTLEIGGGEDYQQVEYNIPWTSTPLEGYEGTQPIYMSIKSIVAEQGGDAEKLKAHLSVRGNGMFSVPVINDIPVGRYKISLNIQNEGYSQDLNDCFTIIVK
jgi:hypothetical protein